MIQTHDQKLVAFKTLKLADYNPREMSAEGMTSLKLGIKTYGLVQPIVARKEDGLVIGGHQRLAALRSLLEDQKASPAEIGAFPVPVVFLAGLDDTKTKLLNIALNKISGDWDSDKLTAVFASLDASMNVELSGFSSDEVAGMLSMSASDAAAGLGTVSADVEAGLGEPVHSFAFSFESPLDAALIKKALEVCGMKGPDDSSAAFLRMAQMVTSK